VLIHLVDLSAAGEDRAPLRDLDVLDHELARYSPELAGKPQLVAANKIDLPEARERLAPFQAAMAARGVRVFPISAATGEGLGPLLDAVAQVLSGGALPTLDRQARPRRRPRSVAVATEDRGPAGETVQVAGTGPAAPRRRSAAPRKPAARGASSRGAKSRKTASGASGKTSSRAAKSSAKKSRASRKPGRPRSRKGRR
jgi:GTP-binding protein